MNRTREAPMTFAFVFVPIAVWLVAAGAAGVNIGIRHVLPVYPFAVLVAGIGAAEFMRRRGVRRVLATAALVAIVAEVARAEPFPLSFFNGLAGGPGNGFRYLADSNLGWGGTLKALQRWMAERHVPTVGFKVA